MTHRFISPRFMLVLTLLLVEAELIGGPITSTPLQAAVALPLCLYLPGSQLRRALLPQTGAESVADDVLTALGLSLALLAVGGILLNLFSVGAHPATWLVYLTFVTLGSEFKACARKGSGVPQIGKLAIGSLFKWFPVGLMLSSVLSAAILISVSGAERQQFSGFAQLWLIPTSPGAYQIGVANHTGHADAYLIRLRVGARLVRAWHIILPSGRSWSGDIRLLARADISGQLFRQGSATPYRYVRIRRPPG